MVSKIVASAISLVAGFLEGPWSSFGSEIAICKPALQKACESAYLGCRLSLPVDDQQNICGCASLYYGTCLPAAGCTGNEEMRSCIGELVEWNCPDMSVCGNDCTLEDGDPRLPAGTIVLPLNNFGANYLQLSVCSKGIDTAKLLHFGQVSMSSCDSQDFRVCHLWVAPRTFTAVAFSPQVTQLQVEQCVRLEGAKTDIWSDNWECLSDPLPAKYYGSTAYYDGSGGSIYDSAYGSVSHWPSAIDVAYSAAMLCEKDTHCPGSFCDLQQQPKTCAAKIREHFVQSGSHFLDPRWQILQRLGEMGDGDGEITGP